MSARSMRSVRTHGRAWRPLAALVALLLALGVVVLGPATAAYADGIDDICKEVPAPVRPDYNVAGWVMDKPDLATVPEVAPDPFADPKIPISDVYGFGWRWTNYDLGCGNDFIRDPNAVVNTNVGNFELAGSAMVTASLSSLEHMARAFDIGWLVDVIVSAASGLKPMVLGVGLPLGVIVVGLLVGLAAKRASYDETMRRALVVLGCAAAAIVTLVFPATAATKMDGLAGSVADASRAGFATQASDVIVRSSLYPTWLMGNFGSADSPTARTYGPRLMAATTYSWSDVKKIQADPSAKADIDKAKAAAYSTIAEEVEKSDPAAYASLTGRVDTRTSSALVGMIWVAIMGFFTTVAQLIMVLGRLIMLGLVVVTPIAVIIGVVNFSVLQRLWDLFAAAVVNIAKFTLAGGLMTLILGALQAAPVGVGQKLLLTVVVTVLAVMLTRPIRSFKSMAGLNPNRSYVSSLIRSGGSALTGINLRRAPGSDAAAETTPPVTAATGRSSGGQAALAGAGSFAALPPPPHLTALSARPTASAALTAGAAGPAVPPRWSSTAALTSGPTVPARARRSESAGATVVEPTGVIVQREGPVREQVVYRSGPVTEDYVPLSEPALAPDGREVGTVRYRSDRTPAAGGRAERAGAGTGRAARTTRYAGAH